MSVSVCGVTVSSQESCSRYKVRGVKHNKERVWWRAGLGDHCDQQLTMA